MYHRLKISLICLLKKRRVHFFAFGLDFTFYTDSQRESLYIVFTPAFFESWIFLCLFFLSAFLSFFLPFFFVCSHFFGPVIEKSINQLFTGAGTLTSLILELEKFWRQFWKSQIKRSKSAYVFFTISTVLAGLAVFWRASPLTGPKL